jgi:hypothetical protein
MREHGVAVGMREQYEKATNQGVQELPLESFQDAGRFSRLWPAKPKRATQRPLRSVRRGFGKRSHLLLWAWFPGLWRSWPGILQQERLSAAARTSWQGRYRWSCLCPSLMTGRTRDLDGLNDPRTFLIPLCKHFISRCEHCCGAAHVSLRNVSAMD